MISSRIFFYNPTIKSSTLFNSLFSIRYSSTSKEAKAKIELTQSKSAIGKSNLTKPEKVELTPGKTYFWCSCGSSKKQPFCDGTHKKINTELPNNAEKFVPFIFKCTEPGFAFLCNCKVSKNRPFCDGTHKSLKNNA